MDESYGGEDDSEKGDGHPADGLQVSLLGRREGLAEDALDIAWGDIHVGVSAGEKTLKRGAGGIGIVTGPRDVRRSFVMGLKYAESTPAEEAEEIFGRWRGLAEIQVRSRSKRGCPGVLYVPEGGDADLKVAVAQLFARPIVPTLAHLFESYRL